MKRISVAISAGLLLLGMGVFIFRDRASQNTVDQLRLGFAKSRKAMPEFAGLYEVRVDIAGDDEDPAFKISKNEVTTSWGGRDSVDQWICSASPSHTFVEIVENKLTKPKRLGHLNLTRTVWSKGDTQFRTNGRGHSTHFSKEHFVFSFNPVLAAFSTESLEIQTALSRSGVWSAKPGSFVLRRFASGTEVHYTEGPHGLQIQSFNNGHSTRKIVETMDVSGYPIPTKIVETGTINGNTQRTITYTFKKRLDPKLYREVQLQEGSNVKDSDTNLSYLVRGGKLVPHPLFYRSRATNWGVVAAYALIPLSLTVLWMRGRRFRSRA